MAYDPSNMKTKELPATIKATVREIKEGMLSDFVEEKALSKWEAVEPTSPAIHIIAETETGMIRKRTLVLPNDNEVHPSSNIARWQKNYGDYPQEGQVIELDLDDKGWYQFRA